jgi:hypothetical protein
MNQSPDVRRLTKLRYDRDGVSARPRQWFLPLAGALFFLLTPFVAFAQKASNAANRPGTSLKGTVTTQNGDVLAGATVKLATIPPIGVPATAETDENGHYEFDNLQSGNYSISVQGTGFKRAEKAVLLKDGEQSVQNFSLDVATVVETVQVTGMATIMSTESSSAPVSVVTNTQLVTLPTQQEQVKEVIPVTPGVVRTLDSKLVFKGSDENQSLLIINSTRNTDPVTGSFGITVPTDAVESFAVYKTPYDSSLGSFSGGLTTIATKSPPDRLDFNITKLGITVLGKNGHMSGLGGANPSISFDVPLIAHKLLFSEAFQYEMKKTTVEGLPWPYDISKKQGFNSYSTVEAILGTNHLLTLTVNAFPLRTEHIDISALIPQPASNSLNQSGVAIALSDRYEFESHAVLSTVGQYTRFDSNAHGYGPEDMLITPQGYGGNYFNTWSRRGKEFQFLSTYEFSKKEWHGSHEIRVGVDIDWRSFFGTTVSHPIQILRGDNSLAETVNFSSVPAQTPSDSIFAEFVQHSRRRRSVLWRASAARCRLGGQPRSNDHSIRYLRRADWASRHLYQRLHGRPESAGFPGHACATEYHTTQRYLECWRGSGIAQEYEARCELPQQPHKRSFRGGAVYRGSANERVFHRTYQHRLLQLSRTGSFRAVYLSRKRSVQSFLHLEPRSRRSQQSFQRHDPLRRACFPPQRVRHSGFRYSKSPYHLGNFRPAMEVYFQSAARRSLRLSLLVDRRRAAVCGHTERAAIPDVFLTRLQGVSHISDTVLEKQERERPSLPPRSLLAEPYQSWEFQHGLQQRGLSRLWQVRRTYLPPRRHDPRLCRLSHI